jgi:predicted histone-like DNA-binding protein
MTIRYNVVPKVDPQNLEAPPKYYPTAVSTGRADMRALAERIAEISTVSTIDSMAMLEALQVVIPDELSQGKIVDLGRFGAFRLTIKASGETAPEDVSADNIKAARVQFKPGQGFKDMLKGLKFRQV